MNNIKARFLGILSSLIYILIIYFVYVYQISPRWSYNRYTFENPSILMTIFAISVALFPSFFLPTKFDRGSKVAYSILYFVAVIPIVLIPVLSVAEFKHFLLSCVVAISFALLSMVHNFDLAKIKLTLSPQIFWTSIALFTIFTMILVISTNGLNLQLASILSDEVSERRLGARETITEGSIVGYLISWQLSGVNPFLIAYGLFKRNYLIFFVGLIGQIFGYSVDASKTTLFSPIIIVFFYYLFKIIYENKLKIHYLYVSFILLVISCSILDILFFPDGVLTSLFVRRFIVTPGLLTGFYFDFFSENPLALLGKGILRGVVEYPYDTGISYIIGAAYFSRDTNANANLWADAFANFGVIGITFFTIILGFVFWIYDSITKHMDARFSGLLMIVPGLVLSQTGIFTSLLTHGVLVICFICVVFQDESDVKTFESSKELDYA
jgi:hypothetical protein